MRWQDSRKAQRNREKKQRVPTPTPVTLGEGEEGKLKTWYKVKQTALVTIWQFQLQNKPIPSDKPSTQYRDLVRQRLAQCAALHRGEDIPSSHKPEKELLEDSLTTGSALGGLLRGGRKENLQVGKSRRPCLSLFWAFLLLLFGFFCLFLLVSTINLQRSPQLY
jgi:hypothetical protein